MDFGGGASSVAKRDEIEPLTAERSRLHVTVSRQFARKLEVARHGLGHAVPHATIEQVLERALDLLLEKQARARGLVKRPRKTHETEMPKTATASNATATATEPATGSATGPATATATETETATAPPTPTSTSTPPPISTPAPTVTTTPTAMDSPAPDLTEPRHRRTGPRRHVPVAIFRAVWQRDGGRCAWPLDGGGVCGSEHRLELDHIVSWALWGGETVDDLRIVCRVHNMLAARQAFGARCVERYSPTSQAREVSSAGSAEPPGSSG